MLGRPVCTAASPLPSPCCRPHPFTLLSVWAPLLYFWGNCCPVHDGRMITELGSFQLCSSAHFSRSVQSVTIASPLRVPPKCRMPSSLCSWSLKVHLEFPTCHLSVPRVHRPKGLPDGGSRRLQVLALLQPPGLPAVRSQP